MAGAADGGLGCVTGIGQEAAGRCALEGSRARPSVASDALAAVCWNGMGMEKCRWSMFAVLCAVHVDGGAVVRARDDVGASVRVQERVVDGLVRARCVVVQHVRLAGDRVVERVCRSGAMVQWGGNFFFYCVVCKLVTPHFPNHSVYKLRSRYFL